MNMSESARHENMLSAVSAANLARMDALIAQAEKNGWNAAICAAREAQPCTAERPNEDAYQRGKFDGVMEYSRALRELHKK